MWKRLVEKASDARNSEACAEPRTTGTQASKRSRDDADGLLQQSPVRRTGVASLLGLGLLEPKSGILLRMQIRW